jgi:hypothetical protein
MSNINKREELIAFQLKNEDRRNNSKRIIIMGISESKEDAISKKSPGENISFVCYDYI